MYTCTVYSLLHDLRERLNLDLIPCRLFKLHGPGITRSYVLVQVFYSSLIYVQECKEHWNLVLWMGGLKSQSFPG